MLTKDNAELFKAFYDALFLRVGLIHSWNWSFKRTRAKEAQRAYSHARVAVLVVL